MLEKVNDGIEGFGMSKYIKELYYITHIDNLNSILKHGILSHQLINKEKISFTPIYNEEIVSKRAKKNVTVSTTLWDFANFYFQARNPMLFKVVHDRTDENIVVIGIKRDVLKTNGVFITDGNAASSATSIILINKAKKSFWDLITSATELSSWSSVDDSKRKIMTECLVPDKVGPDNIQTIYVSKMEIKEKVVQETGGTIPVIPEPNMFFQPTRRIPINRNLWLVVGDMFFSKMQTLTISVNCVGVMGKGLASRAKYQFPQVYVFYQDLCKEKKLRLGNPYLYKTTSPLDYELADEPQSLENGITQTWFLLFPTKDDWRNAADIRGIEKGLRWLCDNYKKEGITSLAMPALGCGLGWLEWSLVGPLLCRYLVQLQIPVWIYLPAEKGLPDEQLKPEFLLGKKGI